MNYAWDMIAVRCIFTRSQHNGVETNRKLVPVRQQSDELAHVADREQVPVALAGAFAVDDDIALGVAVIVGCPGPVVLLLDFAALDLRRGFSGASSHGASPAAVI